MLFETRESTNLDIVKELFTEYLIYAQVDPKSVQKENCSKRWGWLQKNLNSFA